MQGNRPPTLPMFVAGFGILATLNSLHLTPGVVVDAESGTCCWALLILITVVSRKTSLKRIPEPLGQRCVFGFWGDGAVRED